MSKSSKKLEKQRKSGAQIVREIRKKMNHMSVEQKRDLLVKGLGTIFSRPPESFLFCTNCGNFIKEEREVEKPKCEKCGKNIWVRELR